MFTQPKSLTLFLLLFFFSFFLNITRFYTRHLLFFLSLFLLFLLFFLFLFLSRLLLLDPNPDPSVIRLSGTYFNPEYKEYIISESNTYTSNLKPYKASVALARVNSDTGHSITEFIILLGPSQRTGEKGDSSVAGLGCSCFHPSIPLTTLYLPL